MEDNSKFVVIRECTQKEIQNIFHSHPLSTFKRFQKADQLARVECNSIRKKMLPFDLKQLICGYTALY